MFAPHSIYNERAAPIFRQYTAPRSTLHVHCMLLVACTRHTPCQVSAANVPPYVLASTNLDNEQKLQVR